MLRIRSLSVFPVVRLKRAMSTTAVATTATTATTSTTGAEEASSQIHRVKVLNLPTHENSAIKKLLQSHGVERFKKAPKWRYAFINFESEEAAREAMKKLEGVEFKKKTLTSEYSAVNKAAFRERFQNKQKERTEEAENDTRTPAERLADQVTPLHRVPYEEQLAKKHKTSIAHLNKFKRRMTQLQDLNDASKAQIGWAFEKNGLPFEVLDPIASPEINGYRTKCEFTIGRNPESEPTVGFLLGLYRHGITSVLGPDDCLHVPDISKRIASAMQDYVRASEYPVYDRVDKVGVWRSIMVKAQKTGDVLILVQLKSIDLTEEQLAKEKKKLIEYWSNFANKPGNEKFNVTTLLLQVWNGDANGITEKGHTEILIGNGYVYEELLGCRFRLSSSAFFQVNTPATELLYTQCAEWCNIDKNKKTTLLDLCCGTGAIGITMAKSVDRVIGIEMIADAIVDAKANAEMNKIVNVQYHASKVEERIDVVTNEKNEEVVAVLDPPRNGVHSSVVRAVRESPQIRKVIFISCDANQALQNFISLCRPTSNRFKGLPFRPSRAVSIDLFPHTEHCELMIEFVRIDEEKETHHEEATSERA
ncbi:S-adenosyl-L-methionine-dependent methyltransferase [Zychaea mexicana]|uniref:S-adenosyl-L-methionine-dependent methyltransferase n=1 Tax=Zychaea mexicana TaxID=64656 RepID=UPI0022FF19CB|nr:S-adenosyl-L-methionine-dependent methyltransferase [Zychaea mexicana]KAI9498733.1 S-adenosyl-L-methionine-dependent methyltransferase [Zychaea mexicana]